MKIKTRHAPFTIALATLGLFLVALTSFWGWKIFQQRSLVLLYQLQLGLITSSEMEDLKQRSLWMVLSEGLTFLAVIAAGLTWLCVVRVREHRRNEEIQSLFTLWTHECKTPIASIQLQAESLLFREPQSSNQKKYLDRIVQDCARLQSFVERILQIMRTYHAPAFRLETGRLDEDVREWWLREGAPKFHHPVDIAVTGHGIPTAMREPQALFHVLNNVMDNAVKYGNEDSVRIEVARDGAQSIIRVCNHGDGFPENEIPKVGSLYYRCSNAQAKGKGTGLGLYLVRRLMKRMDGSVRFYNQPHTKQTVVELVFPQKAVLRGA